MKKNIVAMGLAATLLVGSASLVLAQTPTPSPTATVTPSPSPIVVRDLAPKVKMVLEVTPNGKVLMRGTIESVTSNEIKVKSWGGTWTVKVTSATKLMPTTDISHMKAGDFVGVQGSVDQTATLTINADLVRDWSIREVIKEARKEVKEIMKNLQPRNFQGTLSNLSSASFTLTIDGVVHTVTLTTDAKIFNAKYLAIASSDMKNGDTIRVYGILSGTTISASVVRDISINQ